MKSIRECVGFTDNLQRDLTVGWNTWDTRSVLRHVLLPEGLCIGLGLAALDKLVWLDQAFFGLHELGRTAGTVLTSLDRSLPIGNALEVRPGLHAYDGSYTEMEVNLRGARFKIETAAEGDGWTALILPLQEEPWPRALTIHVCFLWNRPGYAERVSDRCIRATTPERGISIYAEGKPFADPNLPAVSPYLSFRLDHPVVISAGRPLDLSGAKKAIALARDKLSQSHAKYGALAEAHQAMQSCLAWNAIYEPKFERMLFPVARDWNCKRGGYALFCWDTFLTGWMIGHDDPDRGYAAMLEAFREMVNDSHVPNVAQGSGRRSLDRSQPPVGSLSFLGLYRRHPDQDALSAAWPALLAWNRWWDVARRNRAGSLSLGSDPFTPVVGDPAEFIQPGTAAAAAIESGLDNLPLYDSAPFDPESHLMLTEDVGLNSLYVADCQALAEIGQILGKDVEEIQHREDHYLRRLSALWCEEAECYLDRRLDSGEWCGRRAATCFYPLLAGAPDARQAARLVERHLLHPDEYGGAWMIPSIPRHDPAFPEQLYQRGRVWPPINFLVYLGLKRYGLDKAGGALVERSLELLLQNWRDYRVVAETYSAMDGTGGRGPHTHPLYGWGGLLGFMAMIEHGEIEMPLAPVSHAGGGQKR